MTTAEPPTFLKPGVRLDAYRIRKWVGGGAYGDVYRGMKDGRPYALKLTKHRQSSDDPAKTYLRQLRELVCLVQLDHPNIAKVHGWTRTADGRGYLALDFVEGWTLAEWLQEMHPTFRQVARLFAKLADALEHLHSRGVRHRDISLSNVMVRKSDGEPVIVDLGAGEYSGALELTDAPLPPGTNRYRSPEAALFFKEHRNEPSARYDFPAEDDFYSLAVCLYDALTDAEPAKNADERKVPRINVNSPTMAPSPARTVNARVPEALSVLVERLLDRNLEKRCPALASMRSSLEELAAQECAEWHAEIFAPSGEGAAAPDAVNPARPNARRRVLAWAVAVTVAVLVAAGVAVSMREHSSPAGPPAQAVSESPSSPRASAPEAPPSSPVLPSLEVPSTSVAPVPKERPSVSASKNPLPSPPAAKNSKKAAPVFSPGFLKQCAAAGALAAATMGCPASQVMPERESCPAATVEAMKILELEDGLVIRINVDVKQPDGKNCKRDEDGFCVAVVGDGEIVSETRERLGRMPKGTRLSGRLWTGGSDVVGRYTWARPPGEDGFPVCIALGDNGGVEKRPGSKPGAAMVGTVESARPIFGKWP
ncbi:serine/threonine protein kinase [Pyxidicoccus caerfyrddinensis]|uniref:serine/threonine protein kinase n=1 Tax=Pyxidicoccus caerfyrddinensis TaxID=2709663 RepID=UPI0013D93766|nr:serine/threonine-protein kinase [Pyxidicoccus caerfyrddinensis]